MAPIRRRNLPDRKVFLKSKSNFSHQHCVKQGWWLLFMFCTEKKAGRRALRLPAFLVIVNTFVICGVCADNWSFHTASAGFCAACGGAYRQRSD